MDWLSQWGEMACHWKEKWIKFQLQGKTVQLKGLADSHMGHLKEISVEQVEKSYKGNDIWATIVV